MIGTSRSVWGFDPRSVPGCQLWLDGADATTVTGTTSVTAWRDKSANGYVANSFVNSVPNPSWVPNVRNGNGVIQYSAGNGSSIANFVLAQTMSIFKVYYPINQGTNGPFLEHSPDTNTNLGFYFHANGGENFLINAGTTGYPFPSVNFGNTTVSNTWQMIEGINPDTANLNKIALYVNGITKASGATQSAAITVTNTLYINGRAGANNLSYNTYLAELIIYNIAVTTTQRQQIEGYLAHKWGLTGYYDSSIPLSIPGCQLWLDAADSSTVTGTTSVTQWRDKSGNGRNTTTTGTVSYANSGISITSSSSYLTGSFGSPDYTGSTLTSFIVASMNSASGSVARLFSLGKVGTQDYDNLASITFGRGGGLVLRPYRTVPTSSPPSIPAYDTRFIATWGQTSSLLFNSINGGALSTASLSGAFAINAYRIGNDLLSDDVNEQFNGVINEIVVYFSELTTTQRQTIEGYLSKKWGIGSSSSIPSTHPFSSIRPHLRTFQPIDVPGCQLWLDAADQSSMTLSGSNVTQWNDKSGNGANGTAVGTTPTIASGGGITFSAGAYNTSYSSSLTNESLFVVFGYTRTSGTLSLVGQTGDGARLLSLGAGASTAQLQSSVYNVALGALSLTTTVPINTIGLGELITTNSTMAIFYNGTSVGTPTAVTITSGRTSIIGGASSGGSINASQYFGGIIYEVIGFTSALTTTQRQQVEGYLSHKWGLSPSLPVISPLSIPGCQLWLDGVDPAGNGVQPSNGATVSTWVDKSGNGYNATVAPSRIAGTYSTSFRAVNFATSTTGYITNYSASPTNETMFVVFNNPSSSSYNFILIGGVQGARSLGAGNAAGSYGTSVGNLNTQVAWLASTAAGTYTAGTTVLTTSQFTSSTNTISLNGGTAASGGAPGFTAGRVTYLGVDATDASFYYVGYAMEIIFYNSALTTSQRQQIEGYLARKWGISISATLPSPHPFKSFPPATLPFSPRNISGLALWLDAADQSSMTLSGSSVTQWRDKSGNGYIMTNNGGTTTVATASLNSLTTVYTPSGTNTRITNFTGRTKCTIFIVAKAATSRYLLALNGGFLYTANDSLLYFSPPTGNYLDLVDSVSGSIVSNNTWFILCIGYDNATNSTANPYTINGTTRSTTITPRGTPGILTDQNITSTLYINSTNGTNSYDSVYTAEILYYNDTLTTSQRQTIEGYLAQKWGLTTSLPATHPYKKLPA